MYFIYSIFTNFILIISPFIFLVRILNGKEDIKRFQEKLSVYSGKNLSKTIWFHAASVGELMSIIPIIKKFENDNKVKKIILTTTTTSSAKIFQKLKFSKTIHKYFPLDTNLLTKKFINFWKPQIEIFVESEIWPNMIKNLEKKKIPIIILNARITKKSFERWKVFENFAIKIFSKISLALPQNKETKKYLKLLGTKNIQIAGNLKYYGEKKIINTKKSKLLNRFKKFKVWCAGSTHNSEEILIAKLHKDLKKYEKKLLTIIIPRHINRSKKIINDLRNMNLNVISHASKKKLSENTDIYLVDTFGESSKFYNLTNVTFIGGSIINHGGQNPLEAVRLGNFIVNGPNINNFNEIYAYLKRNKISYTTSNISKIRMAVLEKLNKKLPKMYQEKIFNNGIKILNKNIFYLKKYLI